MAAGEPASACPGLQAEHDRHVQPPVAETDVLAAESVDDLDVLDSKIAPTDLAPRPMRVPHTPPPTTP